MFERGQLNGLEQCLDVGLQLNIFAFFLGPIPRLSHVHVSLGQDGKVFGTAPTQGARDARSKEVIEYI